MLSSAQQWQKDLDYFVVRRERGSIRDDLPIYRARPDAVRLDEKPRKEVKREDVAPEHGIFVIHNILSPEEASQLIGLSSTMGYTEDAPVSLGRDIRRNSNCVWIADQSTLNDVIYLRAREFLPQSFRIQGVQVGPVTGLNARWRLYQYEEQDVFKPHTDGAWPGSGLDGDGNLIEDLHDGTQLSWLTFLLYLSDDIEGGGTRFHLSREGGDVEDVVVRPTTGSALCFWHGYHPKSPLHEGEMVTKGAKYVLRSDVLYAMPAR